MSVRIESREYGDVISLERRGDVKDSVQLFHASGLYMMEYMVSSKAREQVGLARAQGATKFFGTHLVKFP